MQKYIEWYVQDINGDYELCDNREQAREVKRELKQNGLGSKIIRREYQLVSESEVR